VAEELGIDEQGYFLSVGVGFGEFGILVAEEAVCVWGFLRLGGYRRDRGSEADQEA
jgi:hypothetical protein